MKNNNNIPDMSYFQLFIAVGMLASGLVGIYELFNITRLSEWGIIFSILKLLGLVIGYVLFNSYYKEKKKRKVDSKEKKRHESV